MLPKFHYDDTAHRQQKMVCVPAMGGASCLYHYRPRLEGTQLGEIRGELEAEMGIVMIIFHQTPEWNSQEKSLKISFASLKI